MNLANADANTVTVMVADNSYGAATVAKTLAPGQKRSVLLDLHRSHGWYDFTVKAEGVESAAHFAGRVETGAFEFYRPVDGQGQVRLTRRGPRRARCNRLPGPSSPESVLWPRSAMQNHADGAARINNVPRRGRFAEYPGARPVLPENF